MNASTSSPERSITAMASRIIDQLRFFSALGCERRDLRLQNFPHLDDWVEPSAWAILV